jgi:hypothetical protein
MASHLAEYTLEIAFDENVAGVFTVDGSALDGSDGLTDVGLFSGTLDDVSDDVSHDGYQVVFGTDNLMSAIQAANLTFSAARVDEPDFWNPNSPSSPLNSDTPGFVAMRPVRLQAQATFVGAGPSVTVSGNEITDVIRAAALQGDGRTSPDSSFGVWETTTNQIANGGAESNVTGWNQSGATTLTQDGTWAKFGAKSLKVQT